MSPDVVLAVRTALHYLNRASDSWRNGDPSAAGPLHWPVAVAEARRALAAVLEAPVTADEPRISAERSHPRHRSHPSVTDLRELLTEAAERLQGWSAGAGPDGRLIGRIRRALGAETRCPHCGGTGFDGDEPCEFCAGAGREGGPKAHVVGADAGMAWWNGISRDERAHWLAVADSARPADAWAAYRASIEPPERGRLREEIEIARAAAESLP